MVPKKAKDLYKQLAEEQNLSQDLIQTVVEHYYSTIKKNMVNLEHNRINVAGLGQFIVKTSTVDKAIVKTERVLAAQDESTFKGYHYKKVLEEKLALLKRMQIKLSDVRAERQEFRKRKNESSTESNLGEQESNS